MPIELSHEDAYILRRLLTELLDIDSRARCSDKFFRNHFMDMVKTMRAAGTLDRLSRALQNSDNAPQQ